MLGYRPESTFEILHWRFCRDIKSRKVALWWFVPVRDMCGTWRLVFRKADVMTDTVCDGHMLCAHLCLSGGSVLLDEFKSARKNLSITAIEFEC